MVDCQHTFFLKLFSSTQEFHTRRINGAIIGAADTSKTPGTANGPDAAKLDTLHQRVDAMLDQPLPKEGDVFSLPDEFTLGTNSEASTRQG